MANIEKIYRGMQNGAETIDENFKAIDENVVHIVGDEVIAGKKTFTEDVKVKSLEVTGDTDWTNLTPINGFKTDSNSKLQYCIDGGVLYINIQGVITPEIATATPAVIANLPFSIKNTPNFAASAASSSGSGRYANSPAVIYVGTDGAISFNSYITINSGQRVWGSTPIPRFKV